MVYRPNSDDARYADRLDATLRDFEEFRRHVLPLCAAETPLSDYVRSFSLSSIQEKYAMGGPLVVSQGNFVGAEYVLALHQLVMDLCAELFGSTYADPRPTTGIGAVTTLLMTLSEPGQTIALQSSASGGHPSMVSICRRLGLGIAFIPYDYNRLNFDFGKLSKAAISNMYDFVLLAPSDVIYAPPFEDLCLSPSTTVLFDATQTLGLIANKALPNPIHAHERMVILGGTHKTLPGPSSGLVMTCNEEIANQIDGELSPKYLRHSQPQQIASLAACLVEQMSIGTAYAKRIQFCSATLSELLADRGLTILQDGKRATETHQVLISLADGEAKDAYHRFSQAGVTLNQKNKALFGGAGLRLGVQEIARYQWSASDLAIAADLLCDIVADRGDAESWALRVKSLATKNQFRPDLVLDRRTALKRLV